MVQALRRDYRSAPISEQDKVMLDYVVKLTQRRHAMQPAGSREIARGGI